MPEDFYGPEGPGWFWPGVALVAVVLVVAWFVGVWWTTRTPRGAEAARWTDVATPQMWREATLASIDALGAAYRTGQLNARQVFQELSPLVRRYVHATTGRPVHVRALAELRAEGDALAPAVAWMYPEEFAPEAPGAVEAGLAAAAALVGGDVGGAGVDERGRP